jgi:hypothetical protein
MAEPAAPEPSGRTAWWSLWGALAAAALVVGWVAIAQGRNLTAPNLEGLGATQGQ